MDVYCTVPLNRDDLVVSVQVKALSLTDLAGNLNSVASNTVSVTSGNSYKQTINQSKINQSIEQTVFFFCLPFIIFLIL